MKAVKLLLGVLFVAVAVYGFGRFFLSELSPGSQDLGPPAVIFSAPPSYAMEEAGELSRTAAARRLAAALASQPEAGKLGIHFTADGAEIYWLVDRGDPAAPQLVERSAGPTGTRLETTWMGALDERLSWAAEHGRFDAPGLPNGESRNLYH